MLLGHLPYVCHYLLSRVPNLPGKPGILSYTFLDMENARNLLKGWEKSEILTQNLEITLY